MIALKYAICYQHYLSRNSNYSPLVTTQCCDLSERRCTNRRGISKGAPECARELKENLVVQGQFKRLEYRQEC